MRKRFKCKHCGLEIEGRIVNGVIRAWDLSPNDGGPVQSMVCATCDEQNRTIR